MALGVADFLDKTRVDAARLERSIRYVTRHRQAERLNRLAQYDELTGLANRSLFQDRLGRAIAARRHDRLAAVMILDLNGFKAVNDQLGHSAGDRLLTIMGGRLTKRLRETDTIARLGGDEFALLIENLAKPEHAALVARKLLDTVAPPIELDDQQVTVTASLGVALYPRDGADPDALVREADRAMYRAKAEGATSVGSAAIRCSAGSSAARSWRRIFDARSRAVNCCCITSRRSPFPLVHSASPPWSAGRIRSWG